MHGRIFTNRISLNMSFLRDIKQYGSYRMIGIERNIKPQPFSELSWDLATFLCVLKKLDICFIFALWGFQIAFPNCLVMLKPMSQC